MKKNVISGIAVLLAIVLVFGAAIFGLDTVTGPIIEANLAANATGALAEVLPEGKVFEALDMASLVEVPATVVAIHKETAGAGFVVELSTTSDYSAAPLKILMGIDATGAIAGIKTVEYHESLQIAEAFPASFVGQNSTLADVDMALAAGTTYTANAYKGAITDAFAALSANGLVAEAQKGDDQILKELIPSVHTGLVKNGNLEATELGAPGVSAGGVQILTALKANNGTGFAFIAQNGDSKVLAVVNAGGACKVYNVEGADVTAENAAVVTEVTAMASANTDDNSAKEMDTLKRLGGSDSATAVAMDGIFSTVTGVYDLGNGSYGFVARPYGFELMCVYYVLDSNGAIVKMNADEFVFHAEYYGGLSADFNVDNYRNGFVGVTKDSYTGEETLTATVTVTNNAVKEATADIFAAFEIVKGGA